MARQDVCPSLLLLRLYLLLLLLLLLSADSRQQEDSSSSSSPPEEQCPCQRRRMMALKKVPFPKDFITATRSGKINCCVVRFLGYHDPGASVVWKFKDKVYPWPPDVSTYKQHYCGMETLETKGASSNDQGDYTCTVTSSNGTVVTKTMELNVSPNTDFREEPFALVMSGEAYAVVGRNASFTCRAYVGKVSAIPPSLSWIKLCPNGNSCSFANDLPDVNISSVMRDGEITGRLVFARVETAHFGTYSCRAQNGHGKRIGNFSLIEGVPELERTKENYKTIVVAVVVVLLVALLAIYIWSRCGLPLWLYCSHSIVGASVKEGFQQDLFLVHGDSSSSWVWTVLLPMLEDTCGYTCFLPQRDMCGGDQVAESMLGAISMCRRVLVVVTPCLLESPWASWAMCSGIHAVLTSHARMLALILKKETMHVKSPHGETMLGILKVVKQLAVPASCGVQLLKEQEDRMILSAATRLEKERLQPSGLKLTIPEIKIDPAWSNSPKSQRLSNMISGSNTASKENLGAEEDKKTEVLGGGGGGGGGGGDRPPPVIFTEEEFGFQDPGSPCSITPFIMPSSYKNTKASVWESLCRCIHMVFVRDEEQVFWQKVRYRLGPPSRLNPQRKPTTKA